MVSHYQAGWVIFQIAKQWSWGKISSELNNGRQSVTGYFEGYGLWYPNMDL